MAPDVGAQVPNYQGDGFGSVVTPSSLRKAKRNLAIAAVHGQLQAAFQRIRALEAELRATTNTNVRPKPLGTCCHRGKCGVRKVQSVLRADAPPYIPAVPVDQLEAVLSALRPDTDMEAAPDSRWSKVVIDKHRSEKVKQSRESVVPVPIIQCPAGDVEFPVLDECDVKIANRVVVSKAGGDTRAGVGVVSATTAVDAQRRSAHRRSLSAPAPRSQPPEMRDVIVPSAEALSGDDSFFSKVKGTLTRRSARERRFAALAPLEHSNRFLPGTLTHADVVTSVSGAASVLHDPPEADRAVAEPLADMGKKKKCTNKRVKRAAAAAAARQTEVALQEAITTADAERRHLFGDLLLSDESCPWGHNMHPCLGSVEDMCNACQVGVGGKPVLKCSCSFVCCGTCTRIHAAKGHGKGK